MGKDDEDLVFLVCDGQLCLLFNLLQSQSRQELERENSRESQPPATEVAQSTTQGETTSTPAAEVVVPVDLGDVKSSGLARRRSTRQFSSRSQTPSPQTQRKSLGTQVEDKGSSATSSELEKANEQISNLLATVDSQNATITAQAERIKVQQMCQARPHSRFARRLKPNSSRNEVVV